MNRTKLYISFERFKILFFFIQSLRFRKWMEYMDPWNAFYCKREKVDVYKWKIYLFPFFLIIKYNVLNILFSTKLGEYGTEFELVFTEDCTNRSSHTKIFFYFIEKHFLIEYLVNEPSQNKRKKWNSINVSFCFPFASIFMNYFTECA